MTLSDSTPPGDPPPPARRRDIRRRRRETFGQLREERREHRRRRIRRHGRRAYIRSAYSLPTLATLGNAICGFGSMYVATLSGDAGPDHLTAALYNHRFLVAAYLIFMAMLFDALDGRLARFTRHTTDFGGQLDSLADVISFGAAPALLGLHVFKTYVIAFMPGFPPFLSRAIWAIGALYMSCAALRLARFNVSNEHGEQHHFSFLGLPSPGAAGAVAGYVLMQQDLIEEGMTRLATVLAWWMPAVVLFTGLLMVSAIRYPHIVNRYLRGRRSIPRLMAALVVLLLMVVAHRYTLGIGTLGYAVWGFLWWIIWRIRQRTGLTGLPRPRASGPDAGA